MNCTEARAQLARILESNSFRGSKRCSDFLRFVVEETCESRGDLLKERSLGVAVFERPTDYDTNQDPVVRNTAGQVRKRLAQYYYEAGRAEEMRIDLPPGSYVPEFRLVELPASGPAPPPPPPSPRRWPILAFLLVLVGAAGWWLTNRETDLERFWGPLMRQSGPVVLCVGQGHAYKLGGDWDRFFDREDGLEGRAAIPLTDVIPAYSRFVGLTDARALARMAGLFAKLGKEVEVRGGRSTTLADLRGKSTVLIGGFNNTWTLTLTGELRFYFEEDTVKHLSFVRDRQHPANLAWQAPSDLSAAQITEDFAIVSRVFNPTTEQAVVVAAGLRGGATAAAGEFLTSDVYLNEALQGAPSGWERRNVQFVLATRMIGGTPGPAKVIAAHYW